MNAIGQQCKIVTHANRVRTRGTDEPEAYEPRDYILDNGLLPPSRIEMKPRLSATDALEIAQTHRQEPREPLGRHAATRRGHSSPNETRPFVAPWQIECRSCSILPRTRISTMSNAWQQSNQRRVDRRTLPAISHLSGRQERLPSSHGRRHDKTSSEGGGHSFVGPRCPSVRGVHVFVNNTVSALFQECACAVNEPPEYASA